MRITKGGIMKPKEIVTLRKLIICSVVAGLAAYCGTGFADGAAGSLVTVHGQPSYSLSNKNVSVSITAQGGHLTADFACGGKTVSPYYVSPWWDETVDQNICPMVNVIRGDFFCFPMGDNKEPYEGKTYPPHGQTANDNWNLVQGKTAGKDSEVKLTMCLDHGEGTVNKIIKITEGEPVIYCKHVITGFEGKISLGHHPNLQFPDREGAGYIDMSEPLTGFTTPILFEQPQNRGYSALKTNVEITDRTKAPCANGDTWDLTRYPTPKGFEDIAIFINDPSKEFVFSSVSLPDEGYLYFQLKDPRVLSETMLWMSNGGRHYPPWNGRNIGVLGLEEITAYYYFGRTQSVQPNLLQEKGYRTFSDIHAHEPFVVKLIMGIVPISSSFRGVKDIVRKDASTIVIEGKAGERIEVPCKVDFLKK